MIHLRELKTGLAIAVSFSAAACSTSDKLVGVSAPRHTSLTLSAASVTVIDISNGVTGGGARTISRTGIVLGKTGSIRGWWQSPSPNITVLDNGYVQGGNRSADAGGDQGTAILSTNGGAPWVNVTLLSPPGIAAGATLAHDINDSRILVGNTLGSSVYAIKWDNPSATPVKLPLPPLQYPVNQSVARSINNNGVIVGYVYEALPRNKTRYEAIVWSGGTATVLPLPAGGTSQLASNINDAGVISGITDGAYPIRWTPSFGGGYDIAIANIDVRPSNLDTGIDACGRITGGSGSGAWVWDGASAPVLLPGLAGSGHFGQAADISEDGTVVGSAFAGTSKGATITRATIWTGLPACPP